MYTFLIVTDNFFQVADFQTNWFHAIVFGMDYLPTNYPIIWKKKNEKKILEGSMKWFESFETVHMSIDQFGKSLVQWSNQLELTSG